MTNMIDLSIIIPHYNSVSTLKRLLFSIPRKKNIQIIVVDDKTDEQLDELYLLMKSKEYDHVTFLKNNTNKKGAGVCRNIGISKAKGKWILFADSDDFFLKSFYNIVRKYFYSEYDVVFFRPTSIEIDTGNISNRHIKYEKLINEYIEKKDYQSELRLRYQFWVPWSKLIRRRLIHNNDISFDEVIASNDVMFSVKVGHKMSDFFVSKEIIYCVTRSIGTLTTNTSVKVYDARLYVHIKYHKFMKSILEKKDMKLITLYGQTILLQAFKYNLGLKKIILTYFELKRNKIKIFDTRLLNPVFLYKKLKKIYKRYLNDKKYLSS